MRGREECPRLKIRPNVVAEIARWWQQSLESAEQQAGPSLLLM